MKAISPIIASVLLIAFTVAIAGIFSLWMTSFTKETTTTVSKQGEITVTCNYGGVSLTSLKFCGGGMSGIVDNTGNIPLGNVTIQIIYQNYTIVKHVINDSSGSNMALKAGEQGSFNVTCSSNYRTIRVMTNCSNVDDEETTVGTSC